MKKYTRNDITKEMLNEFCEENKIGFQSLQNSLGQWYKDLDLTEYTYDKHLTNDELKDLLVKCGIRFDYYDGIEFHIIDGKYGHINSYSKNQDDIDVFNSFHDKIKTNLVENLILSQLNSKSVEDEISKIDQQIREAEKFANETGVDFNLYVAYGMGGTYDGKEKQWYPSSQSC